MLLVLELKINFILNLVINMNKFKKYLKSHPGATVEEYENQRHKMHVIQASRVFHGKHQGSKNLKQLLSINRYV